MDIAEQVTMALKQHPAVRAVRLVGSRERGTAGNLSDWDFEVDVEDFAKVVRDLPALVSSLDPLAQQWDPLSRRATYMLMLPGAVKVDLLFDRKHEPEAPWKVTADTLKAIDRHFWDWILWIAGRQSAGSSELVQGELTKMSSHLLRPMGIERTPDTIETAISLYMAARGDLENRLRVFVPRQLDDEVRRALQASGYSV